MSKMAGSNIEAVFLMRSKPILVTWLLLVSSVGTAFAEGKLPVPANAAMSALQSMVVSFLAWVLAGGFLGAVLARHFGKSRKHLRQPLFSLSVFAGLCMGVLDHLGKLPWA
ncbi:TPA: hypothetical protein ACWLUJ_005710 [Pseudomonas aeruginosa]|nr:hypothetical protein [Pseudomonas aeruginosa]EIU2863554.1 hypothetical protein [Pseudomonas aeruginosa]HEJ2342741.1 hypothetical protein [Pseudomonas aeruginosa]HEK3716878.1 hypothetical protein [Pseudomonas aeruginosa]